MNAQVAKIIRRFAEIERLEYRGCKNYYLQGDVKRREAHLEMMKLVIAQKGGDSMANQKLCDRPDKTIIGPDDEYLPLKVKQPDGNWLDVDLCAACGMDFQAFLNSNPQRTAPATPAAPQAPEAPANTATADPNAADAAQPGGSTPVENQPGQ